MPTPPSCLFPLRWESTGDQWWYASPIDWAAANGLYDLVTELLHLDTNLLIKLTSLRRIRRLETVWDDESQFQDVATCRSKVARNLMLECDEATGERGHNQNSLIRAGYGGWLLYTAASAGDVGFVRELLGRDPLLVFGEGEYGVTDMLYAAARSKNCEVFNILLDSALSTRKEQKLDDEEGGVGGVNFKRDMVNRAIHAAARGGNWDILKQLLGSVSQVLSYRDARGCTVLHAAAGRGQVEVVRNLMTVSPDIINSTDAQGNTALHVASYRGCLPVVEILIQASPSLTTLTNHNGDTFLHMGVFGFRSPGFRRLDKHNELMKQLLSREIANTRDIINVRNNDGRTALHVAVIHDVQCDVVESLMSFPSIDLNIRDADGMTPLDHLKQRPRSATSEILIKQLISAGGISNCKDHVTRNALVTHLKTHGIGGSPGTSFRISDAEILLYTGIENSSDDATNNIIDQASVESNTCSSEIENYESANCSPYNSKSSNSAANHAARRFKNLLQWPRRRETTKETTSELDLGDDDNSVDSSFSPRKNSEDFPVPLRQRYSKSCSLPNNKRTLSIRTYLPSPSAKKDFTASLLQGVMKVKPHLLLPLPARSISSPFQKVSVSSHSSNNEQKHADGGTLQLNYKQSSFSKKLMNRYFSFGAQGQALEDSNSCTMSNRSYKRSSYLVA